MEKYIMVKANKKEIDPAQNLRKLSFNLKLIAVLTGGL